MKLIPRVGSYPSCQTLIDELLFYHHTACETVILLSSDDADASKWKRYRLFHRDGEMVLERIEPEAKPEDGAE